MFRTRQKMSRFVLECHGSRDAIRPRPRSWSGWGYSIATCKANMRGSVEQEGALFLASFFCAMLQCCSCFRRAPHPMASTKIHAPHNNPPLLRFLPHFLPQCSTVSPESTVRWPKDGPSCLEQAGLRGIYLPSHDLDRPPNVILLSSQIR